MATVGRYDKDLCIRSVGGGREYIIVFSEDGISLIDRSDHKDDDDDIRVKLSLDTISVKLSETHLKSDNFVVGLGDLLFFHEKNSDYVYYVNYKASYINIIDFPSFNSYARDHRIINDKMVLFKNETDIDRISDDGGIYTNVELKETPNKLRRTLNKRYG